MIRRIGWLITRYQYYYQGAGGTPLMLKHRADGLRPRGTKLWKQRHSTPEIKAAVGGLTLTAFDQNGKCWQTGDQTLQGQHPRQFRLYMNNGFYHRRQPKSTQAVSNPS